MKKYTETLPSDSLRDHITNFWKFEVSADESGGSPAVHESLPEASSSIVFLRHQYFHGITILGPHTKKFRQNIVPNSVFIGIRLQPWVRMESVTGNQSKIVNSIIPSPEFLGAVFREISTADLRSDFSGYHLLEKGFTRLCERTSVSVDPLTKFLCVRLTEGKKISGILNDVPASIRRVQKHFKRVTGITMAEYRNIVRLNKAVRTIYLKNTSITHSSYEHGYVDHSHFIHSFRKYMRSSVKDFLATTDTIEHSIKT